MYQLKFTDSKETMDVNLYELELLFGDEAHSVIENTHPDVDCSYEYTGEED